MNSAKPPRLAEWILQEFGPERNHEALAGDLNEAFQQGRSKAWYWRQVVAAIRWRKFFYKLLILVTWSWAITWSKAPVADRLLVMAILMAAFLAFFFVLEILRGKVVLRTVVILIFFLVFPFSGILVWLIWNFAFPRKAQGHTIRELVFGDPNAERQRLMEKLHLAMLQETDPQVCHAYAEAIAALKAHEAPTANVTQ